MIPVSIAHTLVLPDTTLPADCNVMHVWLQDAVAPLLTGSATEVCIAYTSAGADRAERRRRVLLVTAPAQLPNSKEWVYIGTATGGKRNADVQHVFIELLQAEVSTL